MLWHYSIYGLCVSVNLPIPGVVISPATQEVDTQIWLGPMRVRPFEMLELSPNPWYVSPYSDDRGVPNLKVWKLAGGAYFRLCYSDDTEFIVDRTGSQVWATWPDSLTLEDTVVYLLGPVLGFVLRLRGIVCLHASALSVGNQAVALLGAAGAGKSTTAASFARKGYPVLSDDVVALSDQDCAFRVQPAYSHLRLWPTSVSILFGAPNALPKLVPSNSSWDKCYLDLTKDGHRFQRQLLPLAAIYFLDDRCEDSVAPFVQTLSANSGLMALVANTYANYMLDKSMRAQEFDLLSRLLATVPLRRVVPHADPVYLPKLCDVILDDFQLLTRSGFALDVPENVTLGG